MYFSGGVVFVDGFPDKDFQSLSFLALPRTGCRFHCAAGGSERRQSRLAAHGGGGLSAGFGKACTRGYPSRAPPAHGLEKAIANRESRIPNAYRESEFDNWFWGIMP